MQNKKSKKDLEIISIFNKKHPFMYCNELLTWGPVLCYFAFVMIANVNCVKIRARDLKEELNSGVHETINYLLHHLMIIANKYCILFYYAY